MTHAPAGSPDSPSPGPDGTGRRLTQIVHQGMAVNEAVNTTINITFQSLHECRSRHACDSPFSHTARRLALVLDDFVLGLRTQLLRLAGPPDRPASPPDPRGGTDRWR
ncbi:hypothetical protein [Kitasatospora sp. NPDC091207]|uniref:hypothetical protein n=1 Tax=Kitasatospora sp. NPDC091207 TaxID=3364083 RepID=UPI00380193EA